MNKKYQTLAGLASATLILCVLLGNIWMVSFSNSLLPVDGHQIIESTFLPILRYQKISPQSLDATAITPEQLRQDFAYLEKKGYHTINSKQLYDYIILGKSLPPKPVMITFDGGYYGVYEYAFELLQDYEFCAVISTIGKYTDLASYHQLVTLENARLSWSLLHDMVDSGVFEVASHTYDPAVWENLDEDFLFNSQQQLQHDFQSFNHTMWSALGMKPSIFVHDTAPLSEDFLSFLSNQGFHFVLSTQESVNRLDPISYQQHLPLVLNRFSRTPNTPMPSDLP